jgi:hypothetical protein
MDMEFDDTDAVDAMETMDPMDEGDVGDFDDGENGAGEDDGRDDGEEGTSVGGDGREGEDTSDVLDAGDAEEVTNVGEAGYGADAGDGADSESETQENLSSVHREAAPTPELGRKDQVDEEELAAFLSGSSNKRLRKESNKALECLDMAGNVIGIYKTAISAMRAVGVQQGDISMCCRGLKDSINGIRFRFVTISEDDGKGYKPSEETTTLYTRVTTRNRGDAEKNQDSKRGILAPAELKVLQSFLYQEAFLLADLTTCTCIRCENGSELRSPLVD